MTNLFDNNKFLKISRKFTQMEKISRKYNAPVYSFENKTQTPFQILIGTMLSARTKDEMTMKAMNNLFEKIEKPEDLSEMRLSEIEKRIYGVGFYKNKAKYCKEISKILIEKYNSKIPKTSEELQTFPGIGIKTANIVIQRIYGEELIGVDTHVHKIFNRIGIVDTKYPEKTSAILNENIKKNKGKINKIFVAYGQTVCKPKKPLCDDCILKKECNYAKHLYN
jgi:endonuclease III